jgi:hypothetical protein
MAALIATTIAGIELAHRIRKGQFSFGRGRRRRGSSRKGSRPNYSAMHHNHGVEINCDWRFLALLEPNIVYPRSC